MFELADSGSSGGLSLRLSIYLSPSLSLSSSSRPLLPVCLSPPLPFHLLCDAVPCCVGTGVRDRVASDRARTLSSVSSVSSLSHLSDLSLPPFRVSCLFLSFYLSLFLFLSLYSMHYRLNSCLSRRTSRPIARGRRGSPSPLPRGAFMILPIRSAAPAAGIYCHAQ